MLHRLEVNAQTSDDFRQAMRQLASGVSVITAGTGDDRSGFTATSVISLSVDPPRILVSIDARSSTWPVIARTAHFSVAILAAHQQQIAEDFAGRTGLHGPARFRDTGWTETTLGGALANIHCALDQSIERYGHILAIGRPVESSTEPAATNTLTYWRRAFGSLTTEPQV